MELYYEYLHIYEINVNDSLIERIDKIECFLYECECALFILDMTNYESLNLIKKLIKVIELTKFNYLNCIIILNKLDASNEIKIIKNEIKERFSNLLYLEMHLNDEDSFNKIKIKILECINKSESLTSNIITKYCGINKFKLENIRGSFSFVLLGSFPAGKTPFFERFQDKNYQYRYFRTLGIDKAIRYYNIQNDIYKVILWDTSGNERLRNLPKKYYQNADGILLLYDINDENSFEKIPDWIKEIKENTINNEVVKDNIYLLGNKIDLEKRVISKEKAENFAKSKGLKYFEISCKIDMNITEIINKIIFEIYKKTNRLKKIQKYSNSKRKIRKFKTNNLDKYYSY